jgi:hypothetical protein
MYHLCGPADMGWVTCATLYGCTPIFTLNICKLPTAKTINKWQLGRREKPRLLPFLSLLQYNNTQKTYLSHSARNSLTCHLHLSPRMVCVFLRVIYNFFIFGQWDGDTCHLWVKKKWRYGKLTASYVSPPPLATYGVCFSMRVIYNFLIFGQWDGDTCHLWAKKKMKKW